jgi:hypothetical protein
MSTWKKSAASIVAAWVRRNCRHCDTRSHVVSELVEEVWLMPESELRVVFDLSPP